VVVIYDASMREILSPEAAALANLRMPWALTGRMMPLSKL